MATITTYSKAALDKLIADWRQNLQGYKAQSVGGNVTISPAVAGTFALDLTADTTLTIDGKLGQTVVLDVVTGGKKLTVVNGPTITADGVYALLLTRGQWKGGATGTASTGGSTGGTGGGGGSTTPPVDTSATLISSIDFTTLADGTNLTTLKGSNGTPVGGRIDRGIIKGGSFQVATGFVEADIRLVAATTKQRCTYVYDLGADHSNAGGFTPFSLIAGGAQGVGVLLRSDGTIYPPDAGNGFTWENTVHNPDWIVPRSGTAVTTFDSTTATHTLTVNGTLVCTSVGTDYLAKALNPKAGGMGASVTLREGPTMLKSMKVEALK